MVHGVMKEMLISGIDLNVGKDILCMDCVCLAMNQTATTQSPWR